MHSSAIHTPETLTHTFPAQVPPRRSSSTSLKALFAGLESELATLAPAYAARRGAHRLLRPYSTLAALVAKLDERDVEGRPQRASILCLLIHLHRSSPHRLWTSLLLRAFRPMIRRVASKLRGADAEERGSLLLSAFLESLGRVDTRRDPGRIALALRQKTRRTVFRALAKESAWQRVGFDLDADEVADPATVDAPLLRGVWLRGRGMPDGARMELLGTLGDHGALWDLVRRTHPSLPPKQQARCYGRLQDRRRRLVARLRKHLAEEAR
jgi:hypothetical protein